MNRERARATKGAQWLSEPLRGIFDESAQRRVLYLVSGAAAIALGLEISYMVWTGATVTPPLQLAIGLGLVAFLAVPGVVRATSSTAAGTLVVLVAMSGLVIVPAYYQGGASAIFTIWFLLVPLMAGFLLGHRFAVLLGILGALVMTGLFAMEVTGRLPQPTAGVDPLPAWLNLVMVIAFSSTVGAVSSKHSSPHRVASRRPRGRRPPRHVRSRKPSKALPRWTLRVAS